MKNSKPNVKQRNRSSMRGKQGSKDSKSKRVNFDNEREDKFIEHEDRGMDPRNMKRTSKCNDVSWYARNPQLLISAASIPYSEVTGMPLPQGTVSVPGVMQINWCPFVGGTNDAVNIAANEMYSYVVHANSRTTVYDAPDLMLLVIAGAQVFSAIARGLRAYGLMRRYEQMDYYTPDAIINACGFSPSDLKTNYSHMWFDLNRLIAQSRQIWIPNTMPVIERWFWLNSTVFMDGDSVKSQYYVFNQARYYKYNETLTTGGGGLEPITMPSSWSGYITAVQGLIDALIKSQDRGIIFGDILKAYGADRLYSMSEITSEYVTVPAYDREVLSQIENCTVFGVSSTEFGSIYQDANNNTIYQQLRVTDLANTTKVLPAAYFDCAPNKLTINFHQKEVPTPAQTMVATRLMSAGMALAGRTSANKLAFNPWTAGTEVVVYIMYYYNSWQNGSPTITIEQMDMNVNASDPSAFPNFNYQTMLMYNSFDWAPAIQIAVPSDYTFPDLNNGTGTAPAASYAILDYDNYTHIDMGMLKRLNDVAILSEFGVPSNL